MGKGRGCRIPPKHVHETAILSRAIKEVMTSSIEAISPAIEMHVAQCVMASMCHVEAGSVGLAM